MKPAALASHALRVSFVLAIASWFLTALPAAAQYFGRNQVRWEKFDFHVLETPHFRVYHYPAGNPAAADAARMAERWYGRYSTAFSHDFAEKKAIVLYNDHADFQQTALSGGELIGEGTGGFTEPYRDRVVLPLTADYADTDHVLGHELVHVFQFDIAQRMSPVGQQSGQRAVGLESLPLWMVEGLAEYLSQGRNDTLTSSWMRDAVLRDDLPTLQKMSRDLRYNPYQYGQALWAYVGGRWGDPKVAELFRAALRFGPEEAFKNVLGLDWKQFAEEWHRDVKAYYQPILAQRQKPGELGTELIGRKAGGRLAVSPALSPDGRWLAFLSSRELFDVDLYLADAHTGEVVRKLASADRDPHVDELRFIESSGAWSPDGKQFAFAVVAQGNNRLLVVDVDSGKVRERIDPQVGEMSSIAWSPDGRRLVYSGLSQGVGDLYLYELDGGRITKLTADRYADLQPTWSADGKSLLFVSDRGEGADLAELRYAPMGLFVMDVASKQIHALPRLASGTQIDPHFSTDGQWIYFLADPDGVSDVYRMPAAGGAAERLTHIATGVAGITDKSPALAVASDRIVFSVFDERALTLRTLPLTGAPSPAPTAADRTAAVLPPAETARQATLESLLARGGQPAPAAEFPIQDYKSKLGLTYVAPIGVGLYADTYGTGVGGSVAAYWSDVLERHELVVGIQGGSSTSSFQDALGIQALYLDRSSRYVWGVGGSHLPYTSIITAVGQEQVPAGNGQTVLADVIEQDTLTQTVDEAQGLAQYPLSQTRRLEASAAYTRYSFKEEIERVVFVGNNVIEDSTHRLPSGSSLSLVEGGLAYVGDNSQFGFLSPVRGGRMRLEVDQTSGDLSFTTALADLRRYFFMRPLTLAFRVLHYGRYGNDAESNRISPLYVGDEWLVRGYAAGDIRLSECTQVPGSNACPEFDRLIGSRIAVFNAELRIPLFGVEEFGLIKLRQLPTELALFTDVGAAWDQGDSVRWSFDRHATDRVPVASAGVAARILLLGALPLEFYYAKPFQRPQESGVFGFLITPGW
ncbi:MAG TPA: BamA/TamA family outer membrane protein [Thermoanaerobaculia bacterium]|nr:BamA/TamA family outer membrane protein [Thermoanaerobaculia bacterium]